MTAAEREARVRVLVWRIEHFEQLARSAREEARVALNRAFDAEEEAGKWASERSGLLADAAREKFEQERLLALPVEEADRPGPDWEWDEFAKQWRQTGDLRGPAIALPVEG